MSSNENDIFDEMRQEIHDDNEAKFGQHDHAPNGDCLVVSWTGAPSRYNPQAEKERAKLQLKVEENHRNQMEVWRKERTKANVKPW
jgi:hypothetical protein